MKSGQGWLSDQRIICIEIGCHQSRLLASVVMGPGDDAKRQRIHDDALATQPVEMRGNTRRTIAQYKHLSSEFIFDLADSDVGRSLTVEGDVFDRAVKEASDALVEFWADNAERYDKVIRAAAKG